MQYFVHYQQQVESSNAALHVPESLQPNGVYKDDMTICPGGKLKPNIP